MSGPETLPGWLAARARQTPDRAAYWSRDNAAGRWSAVNWAAVLRHVRSLAGRVSSLGLRPGDRVVISLPTSPDWEYCHHGVLAVGGIAVGVDAHDADENIRHILATTDPSAWFLASTDQVRRFEALSGRLPSLVIVADGSEARGCHALADLVGDDDPGNDLTEVGPDQLATIVFTSGSTGMPKGVAYTHRQLSFVGQAILERFPTIQDGARLACWLPLSNLFQRVINLCGLMRGAESYFVDNPTHIIRRLPEIRPALFIAVPRFYEKLHAGILEELGRRPRALQLLANSAWKIGCRFRESDLEGIRPGRLLASAHAVSDRFVLARLRSVMGPDLQFMVSGSAPMPPWLLRRFHGLGWLVLEAYGTSENALPIALNTLEAYRFGSVGRPLEQNELRLAVDGEVLVRGVAVFKGYWGESGADSPLDDEGFLHTGDLGRIDEDGFLWLTGRKSEIFKASTGRRIAPAPIEACLKTIRGVEHAVVFGRNRPYPTVLLCLDKDTYAELGSTEELPDNFLSNLGASISAACERLPDHQKPVAALVSRQPLTIADRHLTSNLKLRRSAIETRYQDDIERLYQGLAGQVRTSSTCKVVEAR